MTVIKINAIEVPAEAGDTLAQRFAHSSGHMDQTPGFEGFELLKPVDDRTTWLVVTRWADEDSFQAWRTSESFARSHGHGGGEKPEDAEQQRPVATASELWSYEVALDRR